jgi:hypothetical protein
MSIFVSMTGHSAKQMADMSLRIWAGPREGCGAQALGGPID